MTDLFVRRERPALVGVLHLLALPGSPGSRLDLVSVEARALEDARALVAGGAQGIVVENFHDAPFAELAEPSTVAAMTRIAGRIRRELPEIALGVNVLRNDARAALAVAAAVDASFIRVNVHVGAMVTDQGVIEGHARETLLERRRLQAGSVRIAADVLVKHAVPLGPQEAGQVARDTWRRGRADALIATGSGTGRPVDPRRIEAIRAAVPEAPLWVGSGVDAATAPELAGRVDVVLVGTWLHRDADLEAPVDPERVRAVARALNS